ILGQPCSCQGLSTIDGAIELGPNNGIGRKLFARLECAVAGVELGLQNSEPLEFRKQKTGRLAHGPDRIISASLFPGRELLLSAREIQVVKQAEASIERRAGC